MGCGVSSTGVQEAGPRGRKGAAPISLRFFIHESLMIPHFFLRVFEGLLSLGYA